MTAEEITVYHNPRCSKSRRAVAILTERGEPFAVYEYLRERPDAPELRRVMAALGIDDPRQMMRTKEDAYQRLNLADAAAGVLVAAMVAHPELIERPIVLRGDRGILARPPERVEAWLAEGG